MNDLTFLLMTGPVIGPKSAPSPAVVDLEKARKERYESFVATVLDLPPDKLIVAKQFPGDKTVVRAKLKQMASEGLLIQFHDKKGGYRWRLV